MDKRRRTPTREIEVRELGLTIIVDEEENILFIKGEGLQVVFTDARTKAEARLEMDRVGISGRIALFINLGDHDFSQTIRDQLMIDPAVSQKFKAYLVEVYGAAYQGRPQAMTSNICTGVIRTLAVSDPNFKMGIQMLFAGIRKYAKEHARRAAERQTHAANGK